MGHLLRDMYDELPAERAAELRRRNLERLAELEERGEERRARLMIVSSAGTAPTRADTEVRGRHERLRPGRPGSAASARCAPPRRSGRLAA
jgi:hypothetical protein